MSGATRAPPRSTTRHSGLEVEFLNLARNRITADAETLRRFDLASAREVERFSNHGGFETAREFVHDVRRILAQHPRDFGAQAAFPGADGVRDRHAARRGRMRRGARAV